MLSVLLIALSIICIAVGRYHIRRVRKLVASGETRRGRRVVRRLFGWGVLFAGFVLMILGVVLWDFVAW